MARNPTPSNTKVELELPTWLLKRSLRDSRTKDTLEREAGREIVDRALKTMRGGGA